MIFNRKAREGSAKSAKSNYHIINRSLRPLRKTLATSAVNGFQSLKQLLRVVQESNADACGQHPDLRRRRNVRTSEWWVVLESNQ